MLLRQECVTALTLLELIDGLVQAHPQAVRFTFVLDNLNHRIGFCYTPKHASWISQGGFKNLQNRSRRRQSAHFSSIIGVLAPTAVGGYDFLKPPCGSAS